MVRTKKIDTTFIHQGMIPEKICNRFVEHYESGKDTSATAKYRGMMSSGKNPTLNLKYKDCEESAYDIRKVKFPEEYLDALGIILNAYKKKYKYVSEGQSPWEICPFVKIQKYYPGKSYSGLHYENQGVGYSLYRHLVFMTYLNDIEEGGGTFWHYQNFTTKPKKGLTVIWPAIWTHTHKGLPAPKELKYICTGWYEWKNDLS